jgi:hypothetical protein
VVGLEVCSALLQALAVAAVQRLDVTGPHVARLPADGPQPPPVRETAQENDQIPARELEDTALRRGAARWQASCGPVGIVDGSPFEVLCERTHTH